MHSAARHLTKMLSTKIPIPEFGQCFSYNRVFYTKFQGEPTTIQEFVPGTFTKYINNNGKCYSFPEQCTAVSKELQLKAECLVHLTYESTDQTDKRLMLLDIQGSEYQLYDLEITTTQLYFFCGNFSIVAIAEFPKKHACDKCCEMLEFPDIPKKSVSVTNIYVLHTASTSDILGYILLALC